MCAISALFYLLKRGEAGGDRIKGPSRWQDKGVMTMRMILLALTLMSNLMSAANAACYTYERTYGGEGSGEYVTQCDDD